MRLHAFRAVVVGLLCSLQSLWAADAAPAGAGLDGMTLPKSDVIFSCDLASLRRAPACKAFLEGVKSTQGPYEEALGISLEDFSKVTLSVVLAPPKEDDTPGAAPAATPADVSVVLACLSLTNDKTWDLEKIAALLEKPLDKTPPSKVEWVTVDGAKVLKFSPSAPPVEGMPSSMETGYAFASESLLFVTNREAVLKRVVPCCMGKEVVPTLVNVELAGLYNSKSMSSGQIRLAVALPPWAQKKLREGAEAEEAAPEGAPADPQKQLKECFSYTESVGLMVAFSDGLELRSRIAVDGPERAQQGTLALNGMLGMFKMMTAASAGKDAQVEGDEQSAMMRDLVNGLSVRQQDRCVLITSKVSPAIMQMLAKKAAAVVEAPGAQGEAAGAEGGEAQPAAPGSGEVKPRPEGQPAEVKPVGPAPDGMKPAEVKPAGPAPDGMKPAEVKPAGPAPDGMKPAVPVSDGMKPAELIPAPAQPAK